LRWCLNLSKSKQVVINEIFYGFAGFVEPLSKAAPNEFEQFFAELQNRVSKISKWKCPKSHMIVPSITVADENNVNVGKYPNGNTVYKLTLKP